VAEIIAAGADSVAVISDIFLASDPVEQAAKYIAVLGDLPPGETPRDVNVSPS
jgi:thiamine monophosphate synthase